MKQYKIKEIIEWGKYRFNMIPITIKQLKMIEQEFISFHKLNTTSIG